MPDINSWWHYHEEIELIYFKKGSGTQFVGDNIRNFKSGDVVLVGSNLPHYWQFSERDKESEIEVYVVHFNKNFWGKDFLYLPENLEISRVIEKSKRGIQIEDNFDNCLTKSIIQVIESQGPKKIINLIEVLLEISKCMKAQILVSLGFRANFQESERDRMQAIYNYTLKNYSQKISLDKIANEAKMSRTSFCKFFKLRTGKTYSEFVNEIRIGNACKMLIEKRMTVKEICFESGFLNFSSFHQCFKEITGQTPLKYQKSYN
ncbi:MULTISPECIES: AraC family transcriptional regulator [Flavobacterium]|uniref:AraC family transcriptional regulator n=1 Tax=Flavobacterium TaxID=237 RepID=UPI0003827BDC|nr:MULTISPECIES: AraC family transcriptional regulator [Flavobacterium]